MNVVVVSLWIDVSLKLFTKFSEPTVWSPKCIICLKSVVYLFCIPPQKMTFWRRGVFDHIFHFPHHRLLNMPFTHSLFFASVPLSHIHHFYKFHPNLISRNIVCDRQKNKWATQWMNVGTDILCTILKKTLPDKMHTLVSFVQIR